MIQVAHGTVEYPSDNLTVHLKRFEAGESPDGSTHRVSLYYWGDPRSVSVSVNGRDLGSHRIPSRDTGPGYQQPRLAFTPRQSPVVVKIDGQEVLRAQVEETDPAASGSTETGTDPISPSEGGNYREWAESEAEDAAESALDDRAGATIEDEVVDEARGGAQDDIADLPTAGSGDAPTQSEIRDAIEGATSDARDVAESANNQLPTSDGLGIGAIATIAAVGVAALTLVIQS